MKHIRRLWISLGALTVALMLLCGPGATWLQVRHKWANPSEGWDAAYLVCGARAQDRRIAALTKWLSQPTSHIQHPTILIGNDPQKSLWCRTHQTNHTRTEWAEEKLKAEIGKLKLEINSRPLPPQMDTRGGNVTGEFLLRNPPVTFTPPASVESPNNFALNHFVPSQQSTSNHPVNPVQAPPTSHLTHPTISIVPGTFHNTDGEMAALATYLRAHPEIKSIALVTSRFHGRRLLQRYRKHIGDHPTPNLIPGSAYWENRAPWIVLAEHLKLLRDHLGLTSHLTRSGREKAE